MTGAQHTVAEKAVCSCCFSFYVTGNTRREWRHRTTWRARCYGRGWSRRAKRFSRSPRTPSESLTLSPPPRSVFTEPIPLIPGSFRHNWCTWSCWKAWRPGEVTSLSLSLSLSLVLHKLCTSKMPRLFVNRQGERGVEGQKGSQGERGRTGTTGRTGPTGSAGE